MPTWLNADDIRYFHEQLIEEQGGLAGPPNEGALDSTLARPQQRLHYEPETNIATLAASYAFGLAQNHCFPDGNKRIALVSIDVFLQVNGYELIADEADAVLVIHELASGELSEEDLKRWIEDNSAPFDLDAE